jgi:hypothetical protein
MEFRSPVLLALTVMAVLFSASIAAAEPAKPIAVTSPVKLDLTYDPGKVEIKKIRRPRRKVVTTQAPLPKYLTRAWAGRSFWMQSKSSIVQIQMGEKKVQAAGLYAKTGLRLGIDSDGDGIVGLSEYRNVSKDGSVLLQMKSGGREMNIQCTKVQMQYDSKKDIITLMRCKATALHGWVGQIDSVDFRIIDDNVDGLYGNDGNDAILIGDSKLAVPLRHYHKIGKHFYALRIRPDGSNVEFQKLKFSDMGLVKSALPTKSLIGLVLENGGGAFNIKDCAKSGIPAGTYYLAFGVVGDPKAPMPFFRAMGMTKYDIQADKTNTLRIGAPLQLIFATKYFKEDKEKKTPNAVAIGRPEFIMGASGEWYGPLSFPHAKHEKGRPAIMIVRGKKILMKTALPERNGGVGSYTWRVPPRMNLRDVKVVMALQTQQLGRILGMRTMKQIAAEEQFAAPKTDKPAVAVTPWNKPDQPAADPKDPKDTKDPKDPKVATKKPEPTTRPGRIVRPPRKPKPPASKETKAGRLLKLARNYIKVGHRDKAGKILASAIEQYPDTKAAQDAKKLLKSMK